MSASLGAAGRPLPTPSADGATVALDNSLRRGSCPVCRSGQVRRLGVIPFRRPVMFSTHQVRLSSPGELWRCGRCDSAFAENIVSEADAAALYRTGSSIEKWAPAQFLESKPAEMIEFIAARLGGMRTALDIGCNAGELMRFLRERGLQVAGVEPSKASREHCIADGFEVSADLGEISSRHDIVFAFDVIEHLHDLPGFLESCRRVMNPGGELILLTGDPTSFVAKALGPRWWYVRAPEHISFPSARGLATIAGFSVAATIATVASAGYRRRWPWRVLGMLRLLLDPRADGLPLPSADHFLISLKRV